MRTTRETRTFVSMQSLRGSSVRTTWRRSCQNSFSRAWSRNGKFRTWLTKMKRNIGNSESTGATSPNSDLKGAPKRWRAVGWASSTISRRTWALRSSRLRSDIVSIRPSSTGIWLPYNALVFLLKCYLV